MSRTIELTDDEFELLICALGVATSAAFSKVDRYQALKFVRLANAVNRDNPNWIPYQIPADPYGSKSAQNTNPAGY